MRQRYKREGEEIEERSKGGEGIEKRLERRKARDKEKKKKINKKNSNLL